MLCSIKLNIPIKKRIPYTISNFEEFSNGQYYTVDKTQYIEKLELIKNPVFLRPKRFGKSLFTEMLRWYYDIKAKDRFSDLFGKYYIGRNPTPNRNKYLVLPLDLSGMDTMADDNELELKKYFNWRIVGQCKRFLTHYEISYT